MMEMFIVENAIPMLGVGTPAERGIMNEVDVINMIVKVFPMWMEKIASTPFSERAAQCKYVLDRIETCLAVGWDDLPDCKRQLEDMRAQVKAEQYKLSQIC